MAAAEPLTLSEQANNAVADAIGIVRRHPRVFGAAAAVWLLVFGGSFAMHVISTPPLPTGPTVAAASARTEVVGPDQDQFEQLAEQAREESAAAEAEMAEQLRKDQAAAAAADAAAARDAALLAKRAKGKRIVRVMPSAAAR
jgi:hypothetical protein